MKIAVKDLLKIESSTGNSITDDRVYVKRIMNLLWTQQELCSRTYNIYKCVLKENMFRVSPKKIKFVEGNLCNTFTLAMIHV